MSTYISCESTLPRSNYKKADWTLYSQLTDQVTKDIRVDGRDINKVVNDFNAGILSEELDRLDEESSAARRECETNPSQDNHSHLQHTKARFLRYKLQARRKSWRNKTASLLEKNGTKLWNLTKQHLKQLASSYQAIKLQKRFADNYQEVSNIPVTKQQQREARREQRERKTHQLQMST